MDQRTYSLNVKVGGSEFHAEGSEAQVRADYQLFLEAVKLASSQTPAPTVTQAAQGGQQEPRHDGGEPIAQALMDKVFQKAGDVVSLRLLPPDSTNRPADAAILLLYGYLKLVAKEQVLVTKLKAGLQKSGISVDRVDRAIEANRSYFMKGGARSGSNYTLNNQGIARAEEMIRQWFQ